MDLHLLRSFAAVADAKHLTRAAERLHLSQPALSAHIRALEDEFGVRLFERSTNGMEITRAGRDLLREAERVLEAAAQLRRAAQALRGQMTGHLRIGTVVDPQALRLGDFLGLAIERCPQLEIELQQTVSMAALEAVRDRSLDASFYFGLLDDPELAGVALDEIEYAVAAPAGWAERVRRADWRAMAALPWVLAPEGSTPRRMVMALFAEHGVTPSKLIEADNERVMANLVAAGVGLALVRRELLRAGERAGTMVRWKHAKPRATLWFIHRADRTDDPQVKALIEMLREVWSTPVATRRPRRLAA